MKNKNGISAIVATVLIILITVAAVTIIWAAIIPMINNQLESGTVCLDAVSAVSLKDEGYTCAGSTNLTFQVARNAKNFDLQDIQVLISVDGNATSINLVEDAKYDVSGLPGPNEEKVYVLNSTNGWDSSFVNATKIQIAPVVKIGATAEPCDISSTKLLTKCN